MKFFILFEFWLNSNVENVEKFFANLVFKQFCKWVKTDIQLARVDKNQSVGGIRIKLAQLI